MSRKVTYSKTFVVKAEELERIEILARKMRSEVLRRMSRNVLEMLKAHVSRFFGRGAGSHPGLKNAH